MEEKEESENTLDSFKENKKGNNKIGLIIIVGILLIAVGVGCFFLGQNFDSKNSSNDDNKEESESNKNKENTSNDNKEENELNKDKEDTSTQNYSFELNNCLNCENIPTDVTIKEIDDLGSDLVKVFVKEDKKTVEINIIAEKINSYGLNIEDKTIVKQLDKNIKKVLITSYGGDQGLLTIHYLMEDGTVEYTKVFDEVLKDNFNNLNDETLFNTKEFNDVKNITKLVSVQYEGDLPAYGVVAITNDGHFYSLKV